MRAIGTRHSITNHFTAQLELDMNAAGVIDKVAGCPDSIQPYPAKLPVSRRTFETLNTSYATSRPSPTMTDVLEDLTGSNVAAGFQKPEDGFHSFGQAPTIIPYFVTDMKRREKEITADQNTRKDSSGGGAESTAAFDSHIHGFPVSTDACCPFEQSSSVPSGDTPSSDSSGSNRMQGTSNTTPPDLNLKSYPYRHIDPSNHGTKPYGIFQADLTSFGDVPAGWDIQNDMGFGSGDQGGTGAQTDFSAFDNNVQSGAGFHDFIGDAPWNTGSRPQ